MTHASQTTEPQRRPLVVAYRGPATDEAAWRRLRRAPFATAAFAIAYGLILLVIAAPELIASLGR